MKIILKNAWNKVRIINWSKILPFILIIVFCMINGWYEKENANFSPINGTYQNQNVWKRVMDGEAPFKDFSAFYGMGQVYIGAFITFLLGGTYADGLVAAEFLTMFFFAMMTFTVLYCVIRKSDVASIVTLAFVVVDMLRPTKIMSLFSDDIISVFNLSRWNSNAHMIRAGIIPIAMVFVILISFRILDKGYEITHCILLKYARMMGSIMALSMLWENLMGPMTYFAYSAVWFFIMMKYYKKHLKQFIYVVFNYVIFGVTTFFIVLFLLTHGGVADWFKCNLSISSELFWYYNNGPKIVRILDLNLDIWIVWGITLLGIYTYKLVKADKIKDIVVDAVLVAVLISSIGANYFYALGSGGNRESILILTVVCVILGWLINIIRTILSDWHNICELRKQIIIGTMVFSMMAALILMKNTLTTRCYQNINGSRGEYVESLGGYVPYTTARDIQIGVETVGDDTLFSTYATAVDVIVDEKQPSGFDYIIHVIGEGNKKQYMNSFFESNPTWVQTIHNEYSIYQLWERDQDWYFYKELYKKYSPYTLSSYATYWKKNSEEKQEFSPNVDIQIEEISNSKYRISVKSDTVNPFIESVKITYDTSNVSLFRTGIWRKIVMVEDTTYGSLLENTSIKSIYWPEKGEREFPITVVDGYGEIYLSVYNAPEVSLVIGKVEPTDSTEIPYKYAHSSALTDSNWVDGANNERKQIIIDNNALNRTIISGVKELCGINGVRVKVENVEERDSHIKVTLSNEADLSKLSYPYLFEVIR